MWILKILLWIVALLLGFLGIFGGVLDISSFTGINIHQGWMLSIALFFFIIERQIKVMSQNWQLNSKRDLQRRIDKLAEYRQSVITKLYAITPTANDFPDWVDSFKKWEEELVDI